MSLMMRILTSMRGRLVGTDAAGNRYYEGRKGLDPYGRRRRWVMYAGPVEASAVPAEWHGWLHHTTVVPVEAPKRPWIKPHIPNLTGTPLGYRPPGSDYRGGQRPAATGDYEAWTPGS